MHSLITHPPPSLLTSLTHCSNLSNTPPLDSAAQPQGHFRPRMVIRPPRVSLPPPVPLHAHLTRAPSPFVYNRAHSSASSISTVTTQPNHTQTRCAPPPTLLDALSKPLGFGRFRAYRGATRVHAHSRPHTRTHAHTRHKTRQDTTRRCPPTESKGKNPDPTFIQVTRASPAPSLSWPGLYCRRGCPGTIRSLEAVAATGHIMVHT